MKTLRADQVKSWVHWLERHEKPLVKLAIVTGFAGSLVKETTYYLNGVTCILIRDEESMRGQGCPFMDTK